MPATPSGISMIVYAIILLIGNCMRALSKLGFKMRIVHLVLDSLSDKQHENKTRKAFGYFVAIFVISSIGTSSAVVVNKYLPTTDDIGGMYLKTESVLDSSVAGARSAMQMNDKKITYFSN